jgi:hypothetical protein
MREYFEEEYRLTMDKARWLERKLGKVPKILARCPDCGKRHGIRPSPSMGDGR